MELRELPDWNCCGASAAHSTDDVLAHQLAGRNLEIAAKEGKDLVIPCAACYSRLKAAEKKEATTTPIRPGKIRVLSILEFLAAPEIQECITPWEDPLPRPMVWTDDYSDLFGLLRKK